MCLFSKLFYYFCTQKARVKMHATEIVVRKDLITLLLTKACGVS